MYKIKSYLQTTYNYIKDKNVQSGKPVRFYNWIGEVGGYWFERFIRSRNIPCHTNNTIAFFSVFGDLFPISFDNARVKVFYTGENLHRNEFGFSYQGYSGCLQSHKLDLSLGFDYLKSESYLRFPLWILYFVDPMATDSLSIKEMCDRISNRLIDNDNSKRFCSLVSGHDPNGLRKEIYESLIDIDEISCGGSFLNNSSELKDVFGNDKIRYLEQFKFNICPENSNASGYVTEKIMGAVSSGAIPVYWGADNNPEPEFLNKDAIIFWNKGEDNVKNINLIRSLNQNARLYREFYSIPRLMPEAAEYLNEIFLELEMKLRKLILLK